MELKIQAVCGFGCGSSLFLRIKIDSVLSKHGLSARTFCGDVGTACSADCDVIFIIKKDVMNVTIGINTKRFAKLGVCKRSSPNKLNAPP